MKSVKQLLTMSAIALASIAAAQGANAASVEPQTQSFLDALVAAKVPAPNTLTPVQARELLAGAQSGKVAKPAAALGVLATMASIWWFALRPRRKGEKDLPGS